MNSVANGSTVISKGCMPRVSGRIPGLDFVFARTLIIYRKNRMSGAESNSSNSSNGDPYRHAYLSDGRAPVSNSQGRIMRSPRTRPLGPGAYAPRNRTANVSDVGGMSEDNFRDAYRDLFEKAHTESVANNIIKLKEKAKHHIGTHTWKNLEELELTNKLNDIQEKQERGKPISPEEFELLNKTNLQEFFRPRVAGPDIAAAHANSDDGYEHHSMPFLRGGKRFKRKHSRKFRGRKNRRTRRR